MSDEPYPGYRIYSFLGRRVLAMPDGSRGLRLAGLARYQPFTIKRKAYRWLLWASIVMGLDRYFSSPAPSPLTEAADFDFHRWLRRACDDLGQGALHGVVYWPPQPDRPRIYVHLFDRGLTPVGFVKVSLDIHNDRLLEKEAGALETLRGVRLKQCRVPRVLSASQFDGKTYLITEPIPLSAKPVPSQPQSFPRACVDEYKGPPRRVGARDAGGLSWWAAYMDVIRDLTGGGFHDALLGSLALGFDVGKAHGDMGAANLVRDGGTLWVYDWESYCEDAPVLADEIGFYMAVNFARILTDPVRELDRFRDRFLRSASEQRRCAVLASLAFRAGSGMDDAKLFLTHWGPPESFTP